MKHQLTQTWGRVRLEPLAQADLEPARLLRNQNRDCFLDTREISPAGQECWFAGYLENPAECMFSVYRQEAWIGTAALFRMEETEAECGRFMIDKTAAPERGMGRETVEAVCRIGFGQLGLIRLYLSVYEDNLPAVNCYRSAGFRVYGHFQDARGRTLLRMERTTREGKMDD